METGSKGDFVRTALRKIRQIPDQIFPSIGTPPPSPGPESFNDSARGLVTKDKAMPPEQTARWRKLTKEAREKIAQQSRDIRTKARNAVRINETVLTLLSFTVEEFLAQQMEIRGRNTAINYPTIKTDIAVEKLSFLRMHGMDANSPLWDNTRFRPMAQELIDRFGDKPKKKGDLYSEPHPNLIDDMRSDLERYVSGFIPVKPQKQPSDN